MIKGGVTRTKLDKRDLSFHRSFGTVVVALPILDYSYDCGKTMPDQNAEGFPLGCRAYTLSDIAGDEDDSIYKTAWTCGKIASYEGTTSIQGGDIRNACKVGQVYGVQRLDETSDGDAYAHRRGRYYNVDQLSGYDWFDSFRTALRTAKAPISVGTIWFPEWEQVAQDGILTSNFVYNGNPDSYAWHNYKICGEKIINNEPYLRVKSWQGPNYGDKGWAYMSRDAFNKAFDIYGTIGIIQPKFTPQDTFTIQLTLLQFVLVYIGRMIGKLAYA